MIMGKNEIKSLSWILGFFLLAYFLPLQHVRFHEAVIAAVTLVQWYAREHVLLCLVPAFFIAGVIAVFVSQAAVIKYFGVAAKKWLSYSLAAVSGTLLAVCSCTVLPLFSGIYRRGAGLGPATAFLYSGPAINILAIILTARILGFELGIARVVGAVGFSIVIGLLMHLIHRREDQERSTIEFADSEQDIGRPLWQTSLHFVVLVLLLVAATWGKPADSSGFWYVVFSRKWLLTAVFGLLLAYSLYTMLKVRLAPLLLTIVLVAALAIMVPTQPLIPFVGGMIGLVVLLSITPGEPQEWLQASWGFARQILPLLAAGVLVAGFLLGTPGNGSAGIIPSSWIARAVGGNSLLANLFASVVGAFMYFATLTEIPILQGLVANGMGQGPALALLLAGPALSLPNMLVIRSVIGTRKTITFVVLVICMSTLSGLIYGALFGPFV
ncbi:MAG: permease [Fidelibacterota bacterium]|nr:MAG: permease [Candidatus Neomarinimicrobiota bacterium]